MLRKSRQAWYSHRALLFAPFVALAMLLGGGGTPNPVTEIALQLVFVVMAAAWIWRGGGGAEAAVLNRWLVLLIVLVLALPVVQLVPLPPAVWHELPGRADAVAALELVGADDSWRPIALSPSRTLASLLATIPVAFCVYAVATLSLAERRLILLVIVGMAVASALLGMVQLLSGSDAFNFYKIFHRGWVTGFQANRNAEADILLIGLLALATLTVQPESRGTASPRARNGRAPMILAAAIGLFILAATVLTGSRAGIALLLPVFAIIGLILALKRETTTPRSLGTLAAVAAVPVLVAAMVFAAALAGSVPVMRALDRFGDVEGQRLAIWQDTLFAISQYWPVGVGTGGFPPTILAAERLEFVNSTFPNRAHNEYLEIGLESGILGYLVAAAALAALLTVAVNSWRKVPDMRPQILFAWGTLLVLGLHSAVDYPLRSMALATLAGVAAGMMARPARGSTDPGSISAPAPG